jgi:peptide deformylase
MAKIVTVPDSILREKSKPVETDQKTLDLVKTLTETLTDTNGKTNGVGLAAIQIGVPKRVFLAYSEKSKKLLVFINPEIVWQSKKLTNEKSHYYEGCLSVPNRWGIVKRPKTVKIRYQSESGQIQTRKFEGQMAIIVQHEYDHLDGILFTDRILEQNGKVYELVKEDDGEEYLKEVKIN